jgi:hypothetical protein
MIGIGRNPNRIPTGYQYLFPLAVNMDTTPFSVNELPPLMLVPVGRKTAELLVKNYERTGCLFDNGRTTYWQTTHGRFEQKLVSYTYFSAKKDT